MSASGAGGQRKRIRVNGVPRRATALCGVLRTVMFAPEDMLLVAGSPGPRRATIDTLAASRTPAFGADLATYGRALQQRNGLLRAIREGAAGRDELRYWDATLIDSGSERRRGPSGNTRGDRRAPPPRARRDRPGRRAG